MKKAKQSESDVEVKRASLIAVVKQLKNAQEWKKHKSHPSKDDEMRQEIGE